MNWRRGCDGIRRYAYRQLWHFCHFTFFVNKKFTLKMLCMKMDSVNSDGSKLSTQYVVLKHTPLHHLHFGMQTRFQSIQIWWAVSPLMTHKCFFYSVCLSPDQAVSAFGFYKCAISRIYSSWNVDCHLEIFGFCRILLVLNELCDIQRDNDEKVSYVCACTLYINHFEYNNVEVKLIYITLPANCRVQIRTLLMYMFGVRAYRPGVTAIHHWRDEEQDKKYEISVLPSSISHHIFAQHITIPLTND